MQKLLVNFKCCKSQRVFTHYRQFLTCDCGKSFFDSGDGFYRRSCGEMDITNLVDSFNYECHECGNKEPLHGNKVCDVCSSDHIHIRTDD